MDHLASALAAASDDPFQTLRVVTSSRATGRVVGQEIAARLGISAGINYLSPSDLMRELAAEAGVATERSRWHGTALELAVSDALSQSQHPLVKRALSDDDTRPGRRRATALRVAQLLRGYLDQSPELVAAWLNGSDLGPGDTPLPHELSWQPAVLRGVVAALELDPVAMMDAICAAARADSTPTFVVAVDHLTQPQERALCALAQGAGITVVQPAEGGEWVAALEAEPMVLDDAPPAPPVVAVHNSHAEARQVEVLRDELTRLFAEDPSLEPRDVVVVCAAPERYSGLLDAVFSPPTTGRTLAAHYGCSRRSPPRPIRCWSCWCVCCGWVRREQRQPSSSKSCSILLWLTGGGSTTAAPSQSWSPARGSDGAWMSSTEPPSILREWSRTPGCVGWTASSLGSLPAPSTMWGWG